jgi:ParB-like chromosome segregation protein Spo0J
VPLASVATQFHANSELVRRYADLMQQGEQFPPVMLKPNVSALYRYAMVDGKHWWWAAKLCGFTHIPAELVEG